MDLARSVSCVVVRNRLALVGNVDKLSQLFSNFVESVKKDREPSQSFFVIYYYLLLLLFKTGRFLVVVGEVW